MDLLQMMDKNYGRKLDRTMDLPLIRLLALQSIRIVHPIGFIPQEFTKTSRKSQGLAPLVQHPPCHAMSSGGSGSHPFT